MNEVEFQLLMEISATLKSIDARLAKMSSDDGRFLDVQVHGEVEVTGSVVAHEGR